MSVNLEGLSTLFGMVSLDCRSGAGWLEYPFNLRIYSPLSVNLNDSKKIAQLKLKITGKFKYI